MSAARQFDRRRAGSNGMSQWQVDGDSRETRPGKVLSPVVTQWEREHSPAWQKRMRAAFGYARRSAKTLALLGFVFTLGFAVASGPDSAVANIRLSQQLDRARAQLTTREGELELAKLDSAAGVAGLIKTVLSLKHQMLPPSLNFEQPNPQIDFASSPFYVNTECRIWPEHSERYSLLWLSHRY